MTKHSTAQTQQGSGLQRPVIAIVGTSMGASHWYSRAGWLRESPGVGYIILAPQI